MSDRERWPITEQELEEYLDGQMSGSRKADFQRRLAEDPDARRMVELQGEIDQRLRRLFAPPEVTVGEVGRWVAGVPRPVRRPAGEGTRGHRRWWLVASAVAAAVAWVGVVWQWMEADRIEPYFQPQSLGEIYQATVRRGFRPYYECKDNRRFALTFQQRQGVPLALAELPPGRRMVGLSYTGGLSRHTTAMLGYADQVPIMVFVDRLNEDRPVVGGKLPQGLHLHRKQLGKLVMYEVSPLAQPMLLDFLVIDAPVDERSIATLF
jgi:hypothetical protein